MECVEDAEMKRRVIICGASDAAKDVLAARAMLVENPLLENDFEPVLIGIDANFDDIVDNGFRKNDVLVLMLGNEYGDIVSEGKSFEELMFEFAGDAGVQRLVFVKATKFASPRQTEFLNQIRCTVVYGRYTAPEEAVRSLFVSLCQLKFDTLPTYEDDDIFIGVPEEDDKAIHMCIDPNGDGETFKFNVTLDDIDLCRLDRFVDAENRYLKRENKPPVTPIEYLIKRNWASAEGRIYDSALAAFGKIAASDTPAVPPKKEKPELTEKDAAEMIGISTRQLRNWERGKNIPAGYPGRQDYAKFLLWLNKSYPKYGKEFVDSRHSAMMSRGCRGRRVSYSEQLAEHQKPLESGS